MNAYVKRVKTRSAWSPGTVIRGELLRTVLESVIRQLNAVDAVQIHGNGCCDTLAQGSHLSPISLCATQFCSPHMIGM